MRHALRYAVSLPVEGRPSWSTLDSASRLPTVQRGCQHDKEEDSSHPLVLTALQVHWRGMGLDGILGRTHQHETRETDNT